MIEGSRPDADWPQQGHVTFKQYSTRYRPGLDLVLRGIDCSFKPGERVGVTWSAAITLSVGTKQHVIGPYMGTIECGTRVVVP